MPIDSLPILYKYAGYGWTVRNIECVISNNKAILCYASVKGLGCVGPPILVGEVSINILLTTRSIICVKFQYRNYDWIIIFQEFKNFSKGSYLIIIKEQIQSIFRKIFYHVVTILALEIYQIFEILNWGWYSEKQLHSYHFQLVFVYSKK